MKRNLLKTTLAWLFLTMLVPLTASAEDILINETNFPDENFRNYLLGEDYGQDGKITDEEIKGITGINVSLHFNISSLKGIEYFTELTMLLCNYNKLTSLDVSQNKALQVLNCSYNQLTSLDVSGCRELTTLYCEFNLLGGARMDAFIESLPVNMSGEEHRLQICNSDYTPSSFSTVENVCTRSQVAAIKAKG